MTTTKDKPLFQILPYDPDAHPVPVLDLDDVTRHYMAEYTGAILSPFDHPEVELYNDENETYKRDMGKADREIMKRLRTFQADQADKARDAVISDLRATVEALRSEVSTLTRTLFGDGTAGAKKGPKCAPMPMIDVHNRPR